MYTPVGSPTSTKTVQEEEKEENSKFYARRINFKWWWWTYRLAAFLHWDMSKVHRVTICDPNGTIGSYIEGHAVDPGTRMIGTRTHFQFHKLIYKLLQTLLEAPCQCNSADQHIALLCLPKHQIVVLEWLDCTCKLEQVWGRDFQSSRHPERPPTERIDQSFDDQRHSARISCYCSHIRLIDTQSFSNWRWKVFFFQFCKEFSVFRKIKYSPHSNMRTSKPLSYLCRLMHYLSLE